MHIQCQHSVLTGQYLQPSKHHLQIMEYVPVDRFERLKKVGEKKGFRYVASGPLIRSSYKAGDLFIENMIKRDRKG